MNTAKSDTRAPIPEPRIASDERRATNHEPRATRHETRLMLLLGMEEDRYGLEAQEVVDVVPMVEMRTLPHAPPYVAGLFSYHGIIVPVIDLCCLMRGRPCRRRLSTRIILMNYAGGDGQTHILGLLAESVTATARVKPVDFSPPNIDVKDAPYLGEIFAGELGMIQRLYVDRLLPESLRDSLFTEQMDQ